MTGRFDHEDRRSFRAVCLAAIITWMVLQPVRDSDAAPPASRNPQAPIQIAADYAVEWATETGSVAVLRGHCRIDQADSSLTSRQMVVWRESGQTASGPVETLAIYLEGDSRAEQPGRTLTEQTQFVTLRSTQPPQVKIGQIRTVTEPEESPLYLRALKRYQPPPGQSVVQPVQPVQQVQHTVIPESEPEIRSVQFQPSPAELRRVRVFPRSAVPYNVLSFESTQSTPPEQIWVLTGGVNLIVDGLDSVGTVDLAADRMVIWTRAGTGDEFRAETVQSRDTPFQVYLEGNIVVRQGQSVLRATSGVYDAREDRAMLMNAELRTFVPQLQGDLRIRAQRIRQLSRDRYYAQNAWTTGSQFGKPGYRLQASEVFLENRPSNPWVGPGSSMDGVVGPDGTPVRNQVPYIRSQGNTFFIEDVPLLYVPYLAAPADDPNFALRRASVRNDDIFGTQLKTVWDMYQLLGLEAPAGTEWDLYADYLSDRGPAVGTGIEYQGTDLFGIAGRHRGEGLLYYIHDTGNDNLGLERRDLDPSKTNRFRAQHRHRQEFSPDLTIQTELGWLSDRNFLEQYFEKEFDEGKDVETLIYVRQQFDNWALTALGRPQLNNFETTTEWLPRGDLYGLGQPLAGGWLNWSSHSSAGYGRLSPGDAPDDPLDLYDPPAYYMDSASGAVLMTRHELNAPFMLGPLNLVPFAMGEAAFWGDDGTGDSLDRLVGSAGLRTSLSFWRTFPYVSSRIFNLNGLAHKIRLEADYIFTDSSEGLSGVPIYNEFDDNAQERFRARLLQNTFGGTLPSQFDPRMYAVRTGAGHYVTSPWHELVDDQQVVRLALRQRLQTKTGPPQRMRIRDWMTLDLEASFFPDDERDNFGEPFGLLGTRYRWNLSERTSLLANTYYDLFDDGQQLWNVGINSQRSARGSVYLGIRQVKGAGLDSQIVSASYTYQMSPKWVSTFGTAYDLKESRNAGQSLTITRVGADFLLHLGASFDESKDNAGIAISIEPRFGPFGGGSGNTQLSSLLNARR